MAGSPFIDVTGGLRGDTGEFNRCFAQDRSLAPGGIEPPVATGLDQDHQNEQCKDESDRGVEAVVEHKALRLDDLTGGNAARRNLASEKIGVGQETERRAGIENLLITGDHGGGDVPEERGKRNEQVAALTHFYEDGGTDTQRDCREELIGDTEERPKTVDAAERIGNALKQKVAPGPAHQGARKKDARVPTGAPQRLPEMAHQVLEHESPHA